MKNGLAKKDKAIDEAVFLCRKCHDLAYRAQQLRAYNKPEKDWIKEAMAFLEKMRSAGAV